MAEKFDIVVIGAGPAGSCAAFTAAQEGLSVLLLEEHSRIGTPLQCAEGLSRSTIKGYLDIKPEWISMNLVGSIARSPSGEEFRIEYPNVGWVLDREAFDPALAQIASDKGALLKTSSKATGIKGNTVHVEEGERTRQYDFRFLIGADGMASNAGRWLGVDTRLDLSEIEVCAEYLLENIRIEPGYTYMIFGNQYAPGGYAWIFPKSKNSANVGLGITPLKTARKAKGLLDDWVGREFPQGTVRKRIFGGVPAKVLKKFSGKDFFLVGDAARFTDPLSGAGIANGIKSGVIAGRNAALRLRGKKDFFEREIEKEVLSEVKFHKKVRDAYLKLNDKDYFAIFKVGKKIFGGKTITDINTRAMVREILLSAPRLLPIGLRLLF
jgi:digeranylgeranylglycerophospholipid reductase